MNYEKSLEELEKTILELYDENKTVPIVVEGDKDIQALRKLGIDGTIISANMGVPIPDFCDRIAKNFKEVIILTDWDRRGGFLCNSIKRNLEGRVICNTRYREVFAKNSMIRTLEGLPSWINTMRERAVNRLNKN